MLGQFTKLSQQQKLSPRQIQLMQLVQLPLTALEERIKEELEANPALEEEEATRNEEPREFETSTDGTESEERFEFDEYLQGYVEDDPITYPNGQAVDEEQYRPEAVQQQSFFEFLERQLPSLDLQSGKEQVIAEQLIGSLDDDGYLSRKISAIVDDLLLRSDIEVRRAEIEEVLQRIQRLDPPGVGARDLQECLSLQLNRKIEEEDYRNGAQLADLILAGRIIEEHFDAFSKKHYEKLIDQLGADEDEVRDALNEILRLNPKPASGFAAKGENAQIVIPDFLVFNNGGSLELQLNQRRQPNLRISSHYERMLDNYSQNGTAGQKRDTVQFIKDKIEAAEWFITAIRQRRDTLIGVMTVIINFQREFFLTGDEKTAATNDPQRHCRPARIRHQHYKPGGK